MAVCIIGAMDSASGMRLTDAKSPYGASGSQTPPCWIYTAEWC